VFEQNVTKIGLLPADLADKVVEFCAYARGTVRDFRTTCDTNWSRCPAVEATRFMEGFLNGVDTMINSARVVVPELKREAARTWTDYLQPTS
jgi:hypothetical protein